MEEYQAIKFLTGWTGYLIAIIPCAAVAVITYLAAKKSFSFNDNDKATANKKIIQTIKGAIIAEAIGGFIEIVKRFYM